MIIKKKKIKIIETHILIVYINLYKIKNNIKKLIIAQC